jgi:hypothetical protein
MGPQLLVDTSSLSNRLDTPIARGSMPAVQTHAPFDSHANDDERHDQVKALVAGTLLFLPLLAAYVVLSGGQ